MDSRENELAILESAALQIESLEHMAEKRFDDIYEKAELDGSVAGVKATREFREWMAARAETDAAWGRWAERTHTA
jgi:hypothetical protein